MNNARKFDAPVQGARLRVVWDNGPVSPIPAGPASLRLAPRTPSAPPITFSALNRKNRGLFLVRPGTQPADIPTDTLAQARRIVAQIEWEIEQRAARERSQRFGLRLAEPLAPPASAFTTLVHRLRSALGA